jgi:hypothetical protein
MPDDTYTGPMNPDPQDGEANVLLYGYVPSKALGIVGVLVFLVVFVPNVYRIFRRVNRRSKTWTFYFFLALGAVSLAPVSA